MTLLQRFGVYSVIGTISLMPLLVLPAMIGTLVDETALSEAQAGWSASLNFFGGAAAALAMALRMHHLDLRRVAILAFTVAALGDLASAFTGNHATVFLLIRLVAGIGAGAAYTVVVAAFARLPDVDRGYGLFVTLQFIVSGLGLYALPVYSEVLGVEGMFLSIAALDVAGLAMTRFLPGRAIDAPGFSGLKTELHVLLAWATLLGALGFAIFEAANTAQFTYVERLGVSLALTDQQVGSALLIASLAGIPGAFVIVLLGSRFGRVAPLTLGIALSICGLLTLITGDSFASYLLGTSLMGFSWAFCLPYIQGLLAELDPHGSAVAAGSASSTIGGSIGPGLAALAVGGGSYTRVLGLSICLLLAALASFWLASRRAVMD
ncbi:MAG: MFS transporter [Xanthomonadales bacterium]|nr:MFS transporter [Xanthomonadales bacterium]